MKSRLVTLVAGLLMTLAVACGGDSAPEVDLADRLTQQAAGSPPVPTAPAGSPVLATPSEVAETPTAAPAATPDAATLLQIRTLGTLVLTEQDLPEGSIVQSQQGAFRDDIIAAQQGVPPLASYLSGSSLRGSWATLFAQAGPPTIALSSIIYLFENDADAAGFVAANAGLQASNYAGATDLELLPSPDIGDVSTLIRVTTADGGSLELTWAQGPMAGQLILRYSGGDEPIDAVERITALAAIQAERMVSFLPRG